MSKTNDSLIWQQYQAGIDYQSKMGFRTAWPEYERFKASEQWATVTDATKEFPRPVLNLVEFIINTKAANVLNQSVKMVFTPEEVAPDDTRSPDAAEIFTLYAEKTWYDIDQNALNDRAVEDAATCGCGIWHYYWDSSKSGGTATKYVGALAGEIIDPLCFFVGNPQCDNVQKQPWVMIASRENLELFKEKLRSYKDANGNQLIKESVISKLQADSNSDIEQYAAEKNRQIADDKITVLTKYKRKNGIVWMQIGTREEDELYSVPLNGNKLYPVEIFPWKWRKRSIYGEGEAKALISIQKNVNMLYGCMTKYSQDMAWPKVLTEPGALGDQRITAQIGQVIENQSGSANAIQYLNPPQMSGAVFQVVNDLINLSRTFSGANDTLTGETVRSDMAVGAIMAIQNQAMQPIKRMRDGFYRSLRNVGRIWEEFGKNYGTLARPLMTEDQMGNPMRKTFVGADYKDVTFDLKIDIGAASTFEESLSTTTLDKFYDKGDISMQTYVEMAPTSAMPHRQKLLRIIQREKQQGETLVQMIQDGALDPNIAAQLGHIGLIPKNIAAQAAQAQPPMPPDPQGEMPPDMQGGAPPPM